MEVGTLLCDAFLCRLCGEENKNGTNLYEFEENKQDLNQLINKYLPLKVENDGKYPRIICPGCNIQLEATKFFFDLIIEGQTKLRELILKQQETLKRQEKQRQHLEDVLKNVNPTSSVEAYAIQSDETGEKFIIQILSDGPLFPPDHDLSLRVEGLDKPKRKRGRPPKQSVGNVEDTAKDLPQEKEHCEAEVEEDEFDGDGRRKRRIKVPSRYQEVLQGKEMDRIFKEEGVIDEDSMSEGETQVENVDNKPDNEIIGHMQGKDGEDLGELVVINKSSNKVKVKPKPGISTAKKKRKFECEICGRIFLHAGRLEVHKSFHKNIKYQCNGDNCTLETESQQDLETHQKKTGHNGTTLIESLDYGQIQLTQVNKAENEMPEQKILQEEQNPLDDNIMDVGEPKVTFKIVCQLCRKTFSCRQNYEVHVKAVHENQKPYKCDKCDKTFSYVNSLRCHNLQHVSEKTYPCDSCSKVFNHPSSLVYHREAEHNNGRKFVCNKCKKTFKHKQLLLRHQLVHSNDRPHSCKFCDATFKTRANLLNHMPMHTGEKKFFCNICGQTFAHKTSLTLHIRWHNGQKPYECDVCLKTFSQKGNLAEHKRIHTGEKPYCCDHCGRKFTTSSQYKLHVKRHTGEKPWQCEYCAKQFLHKDTWKCHTRRHRNERPYQCQKCMRGFTEQWALKKHERLHTGEKPYVCNLCNKSFADSSNLTKHKKIHVRAIQKSDRIIKVVTSEEDDKILYLTYEDGNSNEEEPQTFVHIMDNLDSPGVPLQAEQANPIESTVLSPGDSLQASDKVELASPSPLQLQQVIDNDGNPLSITTADNQNIKVVMSVEDGQQSIQGLLPDGTLVPINLIIQEGKGITAEIITTQPKDLKSDDNTSPLNTETNREIPDSSTVEQLLDTNIHLITEDSQKLENNIQFLTEDGQNVCFVATYNMEDSINPQYLTMS